MVDTLNLVEPMLCLCCSVGLAGPVLLREAVNAVGEQATASLRPAVHAVVCYGLCGVLGTLAKELQHPTFAPVSQAVARRVAYHTFAHVLDLDIKFHLERRTGRLSRILERGEQQTNTSSSSFGSIL